MSNFSINRLCYPFDRQVGCLINKGPNAGKNRYYLDGLYSSLVHFKPRLCLEIGTNFGRSAKVFQHYFDRQMHDGLLVTCDIHRYADLNELNCVKQVIVYPHIPNSHQHHYVKQEEILEHTPDSVDKNVELVSAIKPKFDFIWIDGDHTRSSVMADLEIARRLLAPNGIILLDDTEEFEHDVASIYHDELKTKYRTYDFGDWPCLVGAAIIWPNDNVS